MADIAEGKPIYRLRDFAEERTRTLYVRLPHRIRNTKDVEVLFEGNPRVKLPRQASRACHVIFETLEEKIKGLKSLKNKKVNGKRIVALNPKTEPTGKRLKPKKLVVPKPEPELKITQSLFVSNIKDKTTIDDLKKAFPGCQRVIMLDLNSRGLRSALVKMKSIQEAEEYLRKVNDWPEVNGNKLSLQVDKKISKRKRGAKNKKLKIHGAEEKSSEKDVETEEKNEEEESDSDSEI